MSAAPLVFAGCSLLLLAVGVGLLATGNRGDRRLRERILASRPADAVRTPAPTVLIDAAAIKTSRLQRTAALIGYRAEMPAPYAPSITLVAISACVAGAIAFRVFSMFGLLLGGGMSLLIALGAAGFLFRRKNKAYTALLFRQLPDTISLILRGVCAGLPVAEAVRNVSREVMSPTREEFTRVAGETAVGLPLEIALQRLYLRTGIQEYAFFAVVIGLHAQTGGNLSETLENLADMVRRRVAMVAKAKALAADGRVSAVVVGVLPFAVGTLVAVVNPDYIAEFYTNPRGPILIAVLGVLLLTGVFSLQWMIQRSMQD